MSSQRDVFIDELFNLALVDKDVIFISVDMGAPSLDKWRNELPEQFIFAGISEQNAINIAAGLSSEGKKVYIYFMAVWSSRCFEQIRYSCSMAENAITILGNGVGLGYAPAGPAHTPTEDIAYMRAINNIEIFSPANLNSINSLVKLTHERKKLRYIRLERSTAKNLDFYHPLFDETSFTTLLFQTTQKTNDIDTKVAILSSGYMLGRSVDLCDKLIKFNSSKVIYAVYDVWKIKPIDLSKFVSIFNNFTHIITIEEQTLDGGFGSAIAECIIDSSLVVKQLRIGLPQRFIFENGTREQLLDSNGLSIEYIYNKIIDFIT